MKFSEGEDITFNLSGRITKAIIKKNYDNHIFRVQLTEDSGDWKAGELCLILKRTISIPFEKVLGFDI